MGYNISLATSVNRLTSDNSQIVREIIGCLTDVGGMDCNFFAGKIGKKWILLESGY